MTDANRIAGRVFLTVEGENFMLAGDAEYQLSRVERSEIIGMDGVVDYSEKPIAGHISATIRDKGQQSAAWISTLGNVTVVLELANGKTIVGCKMWVASISAVKTNDMTFDVIWKGFPVEEV